MRKKILIGSMLVLIMLLLMPSIPAIQQKSIEDKARNDLVEQIDFKDVIGTEALGNDVKHILLAMFVLDVALIRLFRAEVLMSCSSTYFNPYLPLEIFFPLIFYRGVYLSETARIWMEYWQSISDELGWNWSLPL